MSQCTVCYMLCEEKFSVAKCQHSFCSSCCEKYIQTSANNFSNAKCLEQGCNKPLDKSLPIYEKLNPQTKSQIAKFQHFLFFKNNPQYKACSMPNCETGYFNRNHDDQRCKTCRTDHCKKCYQIRHLGACKVSNQQVQMNQLGYRRCPSCNIWIQKSRGCQYIDCKCGAKFCYTCGNYFDRDPCRKKQQWKSVNSIRAKMKSLKFTKPQDAVDIIILPIKLPVKIILSVLGLLFNTIITLGMMILFLPGIVIFGCPCGIFHQLLPVNQSQRPNCLLTALLWFCIYPFLIVISFTITFTMIIMYPCWRKGYHHGVYDGFENHILKSTQNYLQCLIDIW